MRLITVLGVVLLQAIYCQSLKQCCPKNTEWLSGQNCTDNKSILLSCPHGMYKLDPREDPATDNFTIIEEELSIANDLMRMAKHRFCVTTDKGSPIALVCFDPEPNVPSPSTWRYILFGVLCVFSALFLYVTLFVYIILPELRDLQGKILMSTMSSLLGAYVLLAAVQLSPDIFMYHQWTCICLAFSMYYCCISSFFWLNLVSFDVWRSVWFHVTIFKEQTWYIIFSAVGWGGPLIFLLIAIMGYHGYGEILDPGFGQNNCWFVGSLETWAYLYGPIACLMSLNILYFSLTCYELWHKYRTFTGTKLKILRFKCMLYLKLILVMGLTWIFEVISYATGTGSTHYWLVTDILNSLQGLVIFILLIVTRKRVRKLLAKKQPFGIKFPKSWSAGEDEECEIEIPDEELKLSQIM